ncbi:hypothetical protein [Amycolatopsis suaedae]|uniref:hypothetical protein n=1 Tax=Amycolatopsis suaedae TaxID=2510978 RepID=UPI00196B176C|nr:hypothetical protein [Amycolatopsis suaedae]
MLARTAVAALAAVLALAGCGSAAPAAAPPPPPPPPSAPPPPPPPPSPTTTTPTAPPKPADGTNLRACTDGACEVEIKEGDVIRFGKQVKATPRIDALTILRVSADGVMVSMSGGMIGTFNGSVTMNNAVNMEMLHVADGSAVVRISRVS